MKIKINYNNYSALMQEIRSRVEDGEFETWSIVNVAIGDSMYKRIVHTPGRDKQYVDVQLKLCNPSDEDYARGLRYMTIVSAKKAGSSLTNEEFRDKSAVVLGRFCEILNRYFSKINEYHVIL